MKKLVVLASLAFALAAMPSVPQRAYACPGQNCSTDDSTATQVPAATDQTGKATQTACTTAGCARPDNASEPSNSAAKGDRLDRGVQQGCTSAACATPEPAPTQVAGPCPTLNCATPEPAPVQVAGPCSGYNCATPEPRTYSGRRAVPHPQLRHP